MKAGIVLAMVSLLAVGTWLVLREGESVDLRPGSETVQVRLGTLRGAIERLPADDSFRILFQGRDQAPVVLSRVEIERVFGVDRVDVLFHQRPNLLFKVFNITSWNSFAWVALGLLGQLAFFLRMLTQWITSERRRESVVPEVFWWLSLLGGMALFAYFVWRKDLVGVLGQTTGVVVYARNLRLIHKRRRSVVTV